MIPLTEPVRPGKFHYPRGCIPFLSLGMYHLRDKGHTPKNPRRRPKSCRHRAYESHFGARPLPSCRDHSGRGGLLYRRSPSSMIIMFTRFLVPIRVAFCRPVRGEVQYMGTSSGTPAEPLRLRCAFHRLRSQNTVASSLVLEPAVQAQDNFSNDDILVMLAWALHLAVSNFVLVTDTAL